MRRVAGFGNPGATFKAQPVEANDASAANGAAPAVSPRQPAAAGAFTIR